MALQHFLEILSAFLFLFSMYSMASMAGLLSERSGIVNIGIEGTMIIGAVWFALLSNLFNGLMGIWWILILSLIISIAISSLYTQLLSVVTIQYMADHTIAGTGLNLLAPALAMLFAGMLTGNTSVVPQSDLKYFTTTLKDGGIFSYLSILTTSISLIVLVSGWFILTKTRVGLRLKASGENPYALETSGVSVNKTKYTSMLFAGALAGFAGAIFAMDKSFHFTVNGSGFISLGILIFGQWSIIGITIGSALIGILVAIFQNWVTVFGGQSQLGYLMNTIPFIIPLIGLMIFKSVSGPASVGKPFRKDMR